MALTFSARLAPIDKYALYAKAVQTPAVDARFFRRLCRDLTGRAPRRLREDFCGTFGVCCEWVKLGRDCTAHGRDLSAEALSYGRERYLSKLTPAQRRRVRLTRQNVLKTGGPSPDLILAQNFSYFALKSRAALKAYFVNCRKSLRRGGVMALDIFGGEGSLRRNVERTVHRGFTFYWEQRGYDPATHEAQCAIHLKLDGRRKTKDVFTYAWRIWTLPEIRDLLAEAGFRRSHVYWEGGGDRVESVWIALLLAEK